MNATLEDAKRLFDEAIELTNQKNYIGALSKYQEAIPIYKEYGKTFYGWDNMGNIFYNLKRYNDSIICHRNALKIYKSEGRTDRLSYSCYRIVMCKDELKQSDSELVSCAEEGAKSQNYHPATFCLSELAVYYNDIAKDYWKSMTYNVTRIEMAIRRLNGEGLSQTDIFMFKNNPSYAQSEKKSCLQAIAWSCYSMSLSHRNIGNLEYCEKHLLQKSLYLYEKAGKKLDPTNYICKRLDEIGLTIIPNKTKPYRRVMELIENI